MANHFVPYFVVSEHDIVLFGSKTMVCLETRQCVVWKQDSVLLPSKTLSCLEKQRRLVWKQDSLVSKQVHVLFGNKTLSYLETGQVCHQVSHVWENHQQQKILFISMAVTGGNLSAHITPTHTVI